jgi:hypothetical protein
MKKLIFIVTILFCLGIFSFGQDKKPTKQEAIDWIIYKIRTNGTAGTGTDESNKAIRYIYNVQMTPANDILFIWTVNGGPANGMTYSIVVKTENICSATYSEKSGFKHVKIALKNPAEVSVKDVSGNPIKIADNKISYVALCLSEKEANIYDRMVKALNDLGAYNCPKPKEVY